MNGIGTLFVVAAPSGAGKTSLVAELTHRETKLKVSVSHTTRPKRQGEEEGINYHFVTEECFKELLNQNAFLEHANVFGHYYGTTRDWVETTLAQGLDVILEIDWQGAQQIRHSFPDSRSIFILPPSRAILRSRLLKRAQDDLTVIDNRMAKARAEMSHYCEFDYIVVNEDFALAVEELHAIVRAERLTQAKQDVRLSSLLTELLAK